MKGAGTRGAVTEKHHADAVLAQCLRGPGCTGGERQIPADHAGGAEYAVGRIHQVHGASASAAQAALASQYLGEGPLQIGALGQDVAVTAVAGEQHVLARQVRTHADRHRFLTGGQVRKSGNLTRARQPLDLSLELSDPDQRPVHALPFVQCRLGHELSSQ